MNLKSSFIFRGYFQTLINPLNHMKFCTKFSLWLFLFVSIRSFCQSQIYINDAFYDRLFRKVLVESQVNNLDTLKQKKYAGNQGPKFGIEAMAITKYPAMGLIGEIPIVKRLSLDFGFMGYNRKYEDIPGTQNFAYLGSFGLAFHSKLLSVHSGVVPRWGNEPIKKIVPSVVNGSDSTYWKDNVKSSLSPYLYFNLPIGKLNFTASAMPTPDLKSFARLGLGLNIQFWRIYTLGYTDRLKSPVGFDYDAGYELRFLFQNGIANWEKYGKTSKNDFKKQKKVYDRNYYIKTRIGRSFTVLDGTEQTLQTELNNSKNNYILFEMAYAYCVGVSLHQKYGFGWRAGVDYSIKNFHIVASYQRNYIMPTSFANRPELNSFFISLIGGIK